MSDNLSWTLVPLCWRSLCDWRGERIGSAIMLLPTGKVMFRDDAGGVCETSMTEADANKLLAHCEALEDKKRQEDSRRVSEALAHRPAQRSQWSKIWG